MAETREIRPQPGPQTQFLATPADIAVYGGAAGGGKTWALLLECMRHAQNPHFGAVIFRRTSPQITNEGGLWDESLKLFPLTGATGLVGSLDWRFPKGANIGMRHLQYERNVFDWQGSQVPLLCFDELTHFSESQFFYMLSRNRSTCGVRPYVRATTNPDINWVKEFLAQWVDRKHPDPAASGELRWFIRVKGELVWAHSVEELAAQYPKKRPKSVTFIRASIFDNKVLLNLNPEYLANLEALPDVERARLLDGDWDVKREGLVYPELLDCVTDDEPPAKGERVGGMDFGFNHPFCALRGILNDDVLWIDWERYRSQCTLPTHSEALPKGVHWWCDPARPDSIMELRIAGHDAIPCLHLGPKPIRDGIDRVTSRIRTGRLKIHRRCQNVLREAGLYQYDPDSPKEEPMDRDNHAMDALRYLITGLDRGRAVDGRPGPPSEEEIAAEKARLKAEQDAAHEARLNPDNDHEWFPDLVDDFE
ncbi:MAG: terminase family protein [Cyanobacteria bacterium REEB65]|nr:terminase family protein [Cyanobacteria bacterium REEB65]